MKKALLALLLVSGSAFAVTGDDPYEQFDASRSLTNQTTINWVRVDNVTAACDAENKRLGYPGYGQRLLACSFRTNDTCKIITGKTTTMWSIGHEVRHCFQGSWHK
jgi:hypothetical protein